MNDKILERTELGPPALRHLQDVLGIGNYPLSQALLDVTKTCKGDMYTYLPPDAPEEAVSNFVHGFWMNRSLSNDCLITCVSELLAEAETHLLVVENRWVRSASWVEDQSCRLKYFRERIYQCCPQHESLDSIRNTFRWGYGPEGIFAVVTSFPRASDPQWLAEEDLREDELRMFATNALLIVVMAWDDEGYVYWSRAEADGGGG